MVAVYSSLDVCAYAPVATSVNATAPATKPPATARNLSLYAVATFSIPRSAFRAKIVATEHYPLLYYLLLAN